MSQISKTVNQDIIVELELKVTINSFSNNNGFKDGQINQAIEEFREQIKNQLENKVNGGFQQQEFLQSVDYVSYDVSNNINCQHEKGRRTSTLSDYWKCSKCGEFFKGN